MSKQVNKELYSQFLLATFGRHSAVWLSELLNQQPAHDSFTRWLSTVKLRPHIIWEYVKPLVDQNSGYLIIDDSVLDHWYGKDMELVCKLYSGTHHRIVNGIGLVSLVWNKHRIIDSAEHLITDFRVYALGSDGKTRHEHCQEMLTQAKERGFIKQIVLMDGWYSATKTLKLIRSAGWVFVAAIKSNRQVSTCPHVYQSVAQLATENGIICWLKQFGQIKLFKLVRPDTDDIEYLATNDCSLTAPDVRDASVRRWKIEEYHRGAKQATGLEECQALNQRAQRNHILCSILAFLALEKWRLDNDISWYEAKQQLIADALREYLKHPTIPLLQPST